jgi:hypothetical protein
MALTLSEIRSLTQDVWMPGAANNWIMGNIMMFKLLQKAQPSPSGEYVRQVLEYAKSRGGAMGPTTIFNTAKKRIYAAARFPWAYFWAGATYDIEDKVKVSGGDSGVDLIMSKLDNMQSTLKDIMGDSLWTAYDTSVTTYGAETIPFYGIADLEAATSAYGSIDYTDLGSFTNADGSSQYIWAPFYDASAYSMAFSTLQLLARNTRVGTDNTKEVIDLIVTTATLKDSFENSLQSQQRFQDAELAKAGFDTINFRTNCPIVVDDKVTAGDVHGFNMDKLFLRPHEEYNFTNPEWMRPTNQEVYTTQIIWTGAFTTSARRAHGLLTTVTA